MPTNVFYSEQTRYIATIAKLTQHTPVFMYIINLNSMLLLIDIAREVN